MKNQYTFILKTLGARGPKIIYGRELNMPSAEYPVYPPKYHGGLEASTPVYKSSLGTPVFSDIELQSADGHRKVKLDRVLMTVNQQKNIVKTAIQGRNGTVKEFISQGDYSIYIEGGIYGVQNQYPIVEMRFFLELLEMNEELVVVCDYLQLFGIHNLVVEQYNFSQEPGMQNVQSFSLNCVSEIPMQIRIKTGI